MTSTSPRNRALGHGREVFGPNWSPDRIATAPGRLELLGNHVDYNGGLVLAAAVDRHVAIAIGSGGDSEGLNLLAIDVSPQPVHIGIEECRDWTAGEGDIGPGEYARGVIAALLARNLPINHGLRLSIAGDVPLGFGMSSSAGLCVGLVLALTSFEPAPRTIVEIAREAEHRSGSPVGAMDQSASVAGGVILFDGRDATFSTLEPDLGDYVFAVADSGITHALGQSSYPARVQESAEALAWLHANGRPELGSLGDLSPSDWESQRPAALARLGETLTRRVDHVVSEVARVRVGLGAVQEADWARFGQLMNESGRSSSQLYDISHPVVDELSELLSRQDGVLGARMMGGGEGGPALALMHRDAVPPVAAMLERDFFPRHASRLEGDRLQPCVFGSGARLQPL
jgi:galactokinase